MTLQHKLLQGKNSAVSVIRGFMLDESNTTEFSLAMDLVLSTEKQKLSRSQAFAHLACFCVAGHKPVD